MVENYLAREIEMLEEIEALHEKVDNVISRVNAHDQKLAQHDELHCKNEVLWARFRARRRTSLASKEVDSSTHCDQLDDLGLIPLSEKQIQHMKATNSSCVRFIGSLVQASFPNGYFENHMPGHVTKLQHKRLYKIISAHFTEIKRGRRKPVKMSLREVVNVIRTYVYNANSRQRKRMSSSIESGESVAELGDNDISNDTVSSNNSSNNNVFNGNVSTDNASNDSVSNDDGFNENDIDDDFCDRPCDPPNHYPDCKNFRGVVHVDGKYQSYENTEWATLRGSKVAQHPKFGVSPVKCGRSPQRAKVLLWGAKTNASANVHQCDICDKSFASHHGMTRHKLIHTDPGTWKKCPFCEYRVTDTSNLKKHVSQHTKDGPNSLKCDICHKKLASKRNLIRHKLKLHQC